MTSTRPPNEPPPLESQPLEPSTLAALGGALSEEGYAELEARKKEFQERVVNRLDPELKAYARACLDERADVEDAIQNVTTQAWTHDAIARCGGIDHRIRRFVMKSMHNEIIDQHRKRRRERGAFANLARFARAKTPDREESIRQTESHEIHLHVDRAIRKLPLSCREAWVLVTILEMPYAVVAELLDISVKTVDTHVTNGNGMVRQMLMAAGYYADRQKQGKKREQV